MHKIPKHCNPNFNKDLNIPLTFIPLLLKVVIKGTSLFWSTIPLQILLYSKRCISVTSEPEFMHPITRNLFTNVIAKTFLSEHEILYIVEEAVAENLEYQAKAVFSILAMSSFWLCFKCSLESCPSLDSHELKVTFLYGHR